MTGVHLLHTILYNICYGLSLQNVDYKINALVVIATVIFFTDVHRLLKSTHGSINIYFEKGSRPCTLLCFLRIIVFIVPGI